MRRTHTLEPAVRREFKLVLKCEDGTELPFIAIKLIESEGVYWVYIQSYKPDNDVFCSAIYDAKGMVDWLGAAKEAIELGLKNASKD